MSAHQQTRESCIADDRTAQRVYVGLYDGGAAKTCRWTAEFARFGSRFERFLRRSNTNYDLCNGLRAVNAVVVCSEDEIVNSRRSGADADRFRD
jgi:hypothetical protein